MLRSTRLLHKFLQLATGYRGLHAARTRTQFPLRGYLQSHSNHLYRRGTSPFALSQAATNLVQHQVLARYADLSSEKYSLIYAFPAIKGLRALSRLKLMQTGITVGLLPSVYYFYLQGQVTVTLLSYTAGIATFAGIMLYLISHYVRRVVGMMYLDTSQTTIKVSHLTFWGRRQDVYVPVSDIMTLADTGDVRSESILCLKRYSSPHTMYFSLRFGRVVDKQAFEKVFGPIS